MNNKRLEPGKPHIDKLKADMNKVDLISGMANRLVYDCEKILYKMHAKGYNLGEVLQQIREFDEIFQCFKASVEYVITPIKVITDEDLDV